MLEDLIKGKENANILLLEDNCQTSGELLLRSIVCSLCQRLSRLHLFLFEYLPRRFLLGLPENVTERITVHNIAGDPLGWDGNVRITMDTDFHGYISRLDDGRDSVAVVFDCLSNLILHRSPAYTCQVLHRAHNKLSSDERNVELVAMVHRDLHDDAVLSMLHHTVSCVLDLGPAPSSTHHGSCRILQKKASGKVVRQREQYRMSSQFEVTDVEEIRMSAESGQHPDPGVDPAASLTFNLSLSEQEKAARSKLVLPYMHKGEKLNAPSSGSAKIFYQPDDADDFDEEDPDDDLDI